LCTDFGVFALFLSVCQRIFAIGPMCAHHHGAGVVVIGAAVLLFVAVLCELLVLRLVLDAMIDNSRERCRFVRFYSS
jgi:hypothetical protein